MVGGGGGEQEGEGRHGYFLSLGGDWQNTGL